MIRYSPIGIVITLLFLVFGPHECFRASDRSGHAQVAASALSSILPDANKVGDLPSRSMVDAVETKQGWIVRTASRGQLRFQLVAGAFLLALAWFLRKTGLIRRQNPAVSEHDDG